MWVCVLRSPGWGQSEMLEPFLGLACLWVLAEAGTWRTPGLALQGDLAGVSLIPWLRSRLPEGAGSPVA